VVLALLTGLSAGAVHVLSGPDHLAAVAPLVAQARARRWRIGLLWGLGHTSGVLTVGVLAVLLRDLLPLGSVSAASERLVGAALVGVGAWGLLKASRSHFHTHEHAHDGVAHTHIHAHGIRARGHDGHHADLVAHRHAHVSFGFGLLHGLAGSSHLFGILPALALPDRASALAYLLAFGVGSIGAMTGFSEAFGWIAARRASGSGRAYRAVLSTCSSLAVVVGVIWLWS
jgi:hypothetical protein